MVLKNNSKYIPANNQEPFDRLLQFLIACSMCNTSVPQKMPHVFHFSNWSKLESTLKRKQKTQSHTEHLYSITYIF